MLASRSETVPDGARWAWEVKWDGVRAQLHVVDRRVLMYTRRGRDVTELLPELASLGSLVGDGCVVDGELVVQREDGGTDFEAVMGRLGATRRRSGSAVTFVAFDLLVDAAEPLYSLPYVERRLRLERRPRLGPSWYVPEYLSGDGLQVFLEICRRGLEGLVAKRLDAPYRSGARVTTWRKLLNPEHPARRRVATRPRR
jgi:bifunctional non-homologous end joining protein LigD